MPLNVQFDPRYGCLRVTIHGPWPSAIEQAQLRARLFQQGVLTADTCVLIDLRAVAPGPTADDIQSAIATAVAQEAAGLRRALLVTTQQYDTVRVIEELGIDEGAPVRLFTDEAAAVRWLTAQRTEASIAASPRPSQTESL